MNYGEFLSSFLIDLQRLFRLELSTEDLTYGQTLAIISIPNDGIEMSNLSLLLGLDNSTVTRLIIRLENKHWVIRKKSKRDKRAIKVFNRKNLEAYIKDKRILDVGILKYSPIKLHTPKTYFSIISCITIFKITLHFI